MSFWAGGGLIPNLPFRFSPKLKTLPFLFKIKLCSSPAEALIIFPYFEYPVPLILCGDFTFAPRLPKPNFPLLLL